MESQDSSNLVIDNLVQKVCRDDAVVVLADHHPTRGRPGQQQEDCITRHKAHTEPHKSYRSSFTKGHDHNKPQRARFSRLALIGKLLPWPFHCRRGRVAPEQESNANYYTI